MASVPITAYILAGGKSSRMGVDKSTLTLHGSTLLEHAAALAGCATPRVRVCGSREKFGADAIPDVYPNSGPLGGIHAALASSETEFNLILAVDTPFVAREFLQFLVAEAQRTGVTVTVPFVAGRFQPLCAVYRREFGPIAERALRAGRYKIDPLFAETTTHRIGEAEFRELAFDARMFDNLNDPEDYRRAQQRK